MNGIFLTIVAVLLTLILIGVNGGNDVYQAHKTCDMSAEIPALAQNCADKLEALK